MANGLLAKNGLIVTGSVEVQNAVTASTFSGDGSGLSGVSDFPYTGSAVISGSLDVKGKTSITGSTYIKGAIWAQGTNSIIYLGSQYSALQIKTGGIYLGGTANNGGNNGVSIGNNAGRFASGNNNALVGTQAGYRAAYSNGYVAIGRDSNSGDSAYNKDNSVGVGIGSNYNGSTNTVAIGGYSGNYSSNTPYTSSVFIGTSAGTKGGSNSVYVGHQSRGDGTGNTALGYQTGRYSSGSNNLFLGYQAGYNLTGSNQLIIANNSSSALVTGDFANNTFNISGSVSASTYYGDGSNLTGIETDPFPYTGSAVISGSLEVIGDITGSNFLATNGIKSTGNIDSGTNKVGLVSSWNQYMHPQGGSGEFRFNNGTGGGFFYTWVQNGDERMRLSTSNYLGIGTSSPQERLHVNGNAVITGSNSLSGTYALKVANSSGTDILAVENDSNTRINGKLGINTNNSAFSSLKIIDPSSNNTEVIIGTRANNAGTHILGFSHHTSVASIATGIISKTDNSYGNGTMYLCVRQGSDGSRITTSDAVMRLQDNNITFYQPITYNQNTFRIGGANSGDTYFYFRPQSKAAIASKYLGSYNRGDFRILTYPNADGTQVNITDHTRLLVTGDGQTEISGSLTANQGIDVIGNVSASTYYGDGSNLTGIDSSDFSNLPTSDPSIAGRLFQTSSDAIGASAGFQVVLISQG